MDNGLKEIRKDALQNGLILGGVLLLLDIIALYVLANSESILVVFLSYLFGYLIIPITAAVILIKRLREKIGGFWNLRQATSGIFIVFISAYLISSAGSFVFIKYIYPEITLKAKDNLVGLTSDFLNKLNADPDKIDEMVENIELQFESIGQNSVGSIISNLLSSIIILFITALIFAAIFKRERPIAIDHPENSIS